MCVECAVELLDAFHSNNVTVEELFTEAFLEAAIDNGTLPLGLKVEDLDGEKAIYLPPSFSRECNTSLECVPLVIINQTLQMDYEIRGTVYTNIAHQFLVIHIARGV